MLVLSAIGLAVAGTAGARLLQGYLVARLDAQLEAVALRASHFAAEFPSGGRFGGRGLPDGTMTELVGQNGSVVFSVPASLPDGAQVPGAPQLTSAELASHAGTSFTVGGTSGSVAPWRVYVTSVPSGQLVVAASLADIDSTVSRLVLIDLLVGIAVLAGLGVAGYAMVRASLRPLAAMEATAGAIAGGDLSRRVPERDPRTEVGRLARALNGMLGQIEAAFRARAESERAARRSEERMRQFVADASHELRTPLTSIRGFAELARHDATDELDPRVLLGHVEAEAKRMALLVDDLLLLARLDEQRPLQAEPVDLLAVVTASVRAARLRAPGRTIELVVGGRDDAAAGSNETERPLIVLGDEARLRQVVDNLVGNAIVHTPPAAEVRIRVASTPPPDAQAVVQVADTGPGLRPADAERVFERFYRVDRARSRSSGGSGLGLSIVAAIVQAHGGSVEVGTPEGGGAVFTVRLPLAPDDEAGGLGARSRGASDAASDGSGAAPGGAEASETFSKL